MPVYQYNLTPDQFRAAIPHLRAAGITGSHRETHDGYLLKINARDSAEKARAAEIIRYAITLKPNR